MMQMQLTTDYAMRIISYLMVSDAYDPNSLVKAKFMANKLGIDYQYSMKIINQLKKMGILNSVQGCAGGYYLSEFAKDLTFYDVITVMEGEIFVNKCLETGECTRDKDQDCPIRCEMHILQDALVGKLREIKLTEVLKNGF